MKIRNLMGAMIALAGLAFGGSAFAAGGDIVDIRAVDSSGMRFGSRSRESGMFPDDLICSEKNPLVAGETVYFRVRMQVLNAYEVWSSGGSLTPKTWRFWDVANAKWAEDGVGPKLGLSIGNRVAWADFSPTGVEFTQFSGELQYDDDGNSTLAYRYYTDFYFSYRVQPGDVGQPIRLINKDLGIPSATEISSVPYGFLGLNVGSSAYILKNEEGTEANLCRASGLVAQWPTGPWTGTAWDGPVLSYDLSQEGVFVKTVDFDKYDAAGDLWQPGKPWRRVTPGGYDKACPAATLAVEGDVPAEDTIPLYVWSGDTNVFTIAGGSCQKINIGTTDDPKLIDVYTVQIQKGRTASDAITLRGAPGVALTASAEIFMTSTKGVVTYDAAGTPTIVAMSRPITVTEAQPPTVKIRVNNRTDTQPKVPVVADADYTVPKADLWVIVEGETATKTVVDLKATVGGSGSLATLVKNNIVRLSESDYPTEQADSIGQVEIPAGEGTRQAIVHLYALGTDDDVRTDGIKFQPVIVSGDPEVTLDKSPSSNVVIDRQGEEAIKFIQTNPADGSSKTLTKTDSWTIRVKFADSYRNYFKPKAGAPYTYTGYTFKFMDDETGDEYVFAEGVTPASAGSWISVTGKVNWDGFAIGSHPDMYFYGEAMDGSTTERIRYTINLTTSTKVVTIGLYDPTHPTTVCESDTGAIEVKLGLKSPYENGYIFLRPATDSDVGLVESDLFRFGAAIDSEDNMQVTNPGLVRYLDGKEGVGTPVVVKAFLGTTYDDPESTVANWSEGQLRLIVTNKAPVVKALKVANMNFKASDSGKVTATVPSGVEKKFALTSVDDVKADWDSMDIKWVIGETVVEKHGDPTNAANTVTHTFGPNLAGKTVEVEVYVKDKDMTTYPDLPNFSCLMPIGPKPGVRIETEGTVSDTFMETATDGSQTVRLTLSEPATEEMAVRFTVGNPSSGDGYILFQTTEGVVEAGEEKDEYVVKFPATVTTRTLRVVKVGGMDGTGTTEDGIVLNAAVTNETENADGIAWKDYFSAADPLPVYVMNVAPQFKHPSDLECATTNESASINTPYSIKIQAADVPADVTNRWTYAGQEVQGIRFEVSVDNVPLTNGFLTVSSVVSAVQATDLTMVNVEFDSVGVHTVEVVFEDKDGAGLDDPRQIIFNVKSSKVLKLFPVGPGPANSTLGSAYAGYPGIGAGRVFAGLASQGPQKVENFIHTYSFLNTQKDVDAWAFGYPADGKADDGNLVPGPDIGIDATGNWNKTLTIDDYYNYTEDHKYGKSGYDSFMYGWIGGAASDEGETEAKLFPYLQKTGYKSIALPDGNSNSGSSDSKGEVKTYPLQKWEAVFSREFLKSDNCGDINADGIPDCILFGYGLGIVDVVTKEITGEGGDKADASGFNGDQNPNPRGYAGESTEGDFLPVEPVAMYDDIIPGLISSWDEPFTAILEVRGVTSERNAVSPLNDALAAEFPDGVANRLAQPEFESDVCFLDPDTNPTSTLSRVEFMAWREYAAANGIADPDDPASWRKAGRLVWSPERPTDPTLVDTDGDGFPDGYEYYHWYRAHVGWIDANGVHRRLTGRRYDERNPGEGTLITSEELEIAMDPIVASGNLEQDTDNDGLPDILEMVIGTNPFDFDTDGDGLPDGFELCNVGNLNPLKPASHLDGKSDTERNSDGDAMAITSYALEKTQKPPKLDFEHAKRTTFAVIDPNGDTDGVQWYAVKGAPADVAVESVTNAASVWSFEADDRFFVSTEKPVLTADGILAKTLAKGTAFVSTKPERIITPIPEEDQEPDGPTETTNFVAAALYPVRLAAGMPVTNLSDEPIDGVVTTLAAGIDAKDANACWIYGKGPQNARYGEVAKTAADYGCLALGRQLAAAKGAQVVALPDDARDVAFLHYLVYQEFGFDARTAWTKNDPIAARWDTSGEGFSDMTTVQQGGYVRTPSRTRDYANYDEFLVYSFFVNNGCEMSGETRITDPDATPLVVIWDAFTTNPQGPNEKLPPTSGETTVKSYGRGENGADTDADGVPDGWELYIMAGPKKNGAYVFAPPYAGFVTKFSGTATKRSHWSPFLADASTADSYNPLYVMESGVIDTLSELREFSCTDACAYYAEYATTILPREQQTGAQLPDIYTADDSKWLNKFLPTDPWNNDTDDDGIVDSAEQGAFAYGTPADDGKLWSIPGGGLNPCSIDTDLDGLPDGWENQFTKSAAERHIYEGENAFRVTVDGNKVGNPLEGLDNCMDGTVPDAYNIVNGDSSFESSAQTTWTRITPDGRRWSGHVDRDYDHDGLENWQEYLVGTMRCWRYDDPVSPWTAFDESVYFDEDGDFDPVRSAEILGIGGEDDDEKAAAFWYETLVNSAGPFYNPHFITGMSPTAQYFTRVKNPWDCAYLDATLSGGKHDGAYYYFKDKVGGQKIEDTWAKVLPLPDGSRKAPSKYISCSPIDWDTDCDGMDDYYELFHGLNPILGASGVKSDSGNACDIVYDAWCNTSALAANGSGETKNYWQRNPWKAARGENGMDFEVFPYLNGLKEADPDGDDIRNKNEFLSVRMADVGSHTDPTPLWMTDSSYSNSLTRLHYRVPMRTKGISLRGAEEFTHNDVTYRFTDFDGFGPVGLEMGFMPFNLDAFWGVAADDEPNWMFSFEENEGFDTDHDALGDREERDGLYRAATDPLDADSPRRRQAMYFPGANAALQTMPEVREEYPVATKTWPTDPSFLNFTVECWVKPEDLVRDQTVIERAIWTDPSNPGDQEYLRRNFQIAIRGGKWMAKYDSGTLTNDEVKAFSREPAAAKWTHLAATFDGSEFRLYVDGICQNGNTCGVKTLPENGVSAYAFVKGTGEGSTKRTGDYAWDVKYECKAILVGASFKGSAEGGKPEALDVTSALGWDFYRDFFQGYVDEIRIWDGARTSKEIGDDMLKRYTAADAKANRTAFYDQWVNGEDRYAKATTVRVVPELRYHFHFDSVPGAADADSVMKAPTGFQNAGGKPVLSRPVGYAIDWFASVAGGYGTVYGPDFDWIQWIPNTVAHLPRFDGTTLDSFFWSEDYSGKSADANRFERSAEPVSRWTQMAYNGADRSALYKTTPMRHHFVYEVQNASSNGMSAVSLYRFSGRHLNQMGDDLLPLGGAFVKYAPDLWDGQGPSTQWEHTGVDSAASMLPDWYAEYVRRTYGLEGEIDPDTEVFAFGRSMKVRELYLRDLARGIVLTADGKSGEFDPARVQIADSYASGMPDWWTALYRIDGESGLADHDNDGLPNYVEYLLSEVFDFEVLFDPRDPDSVQPGIPDYFYRPEGCQLYVGEIFTDHDRMYDIWEDRYPVSQLSRLAFDAYGDPDGDGWSNISEMLAGTDPTRTRNLGIEDQVLAEYPVPMIRTRVKIPDNLPESTPIVVQAFSKSIDGKPDATWTTGAAGGLFAKEKIVGTNPGGVKRYYLSPGSISQGKVEVFFNDESALTEYYTVIDGKMTLTKSVFTGSGWYPVLTDRPRKDDSTFGDLVKYDGEIGGWINYVTGELELDFTCDALQEAAYVGETGTAGTGDNAQATEERTVMDLTRAIVSISWSAKLVKQGSLSDLYLSDADEGYVREGKNTFIVWADRDGSGTWQPGEPYGIVSDVDVSWSGTTAELELTDLSPVTPRIMLAGSSEGGKGTETKKEEGEGSEGDPDELDPASDRGRTLSSIIARLRQNLEYEYSGRTTTIAYSNALARLEWIDNNLIETTSFAADEFREQRLRVVRWLINGVPAYRAGSNMRTVLDKRIRTDLKTSLTEADFLVGDENVFDLDWNDLYREVIDNSGVLSSVGNVTEVSYLVVFGDGPADWTLQSTNNYAVKALNTVIVRKFGKTPVKPVAVAPGVTDNGIVNSANPTFKWTMDCPEDEGYTAFNVQVLDGTTVIYDSDKQLAPPRNAEGEYVWEAPLYVGDKTQKGEVFADKKAYTWKVAMYNAKFSNAANYSSAGRFLMEVQTNGYKYGSANVAVRYYGPKSSYQKNDSTIRVRAYTSPDFTGLPVAAGYVAVQDSVTDTTVTNANCTVVGIPKGSYYLQAFIDSNANGACDKWETQGYLCTRDGSTPDYLDPTPITFDAEIGTGDLAAIYLEDMDTDGDGLPDAWEYAEFGSLTAKGVEKLTETKTGEFVVNEELSGALNLQANAKVPTAGLAGEIGSRLNNAGVLALAMGAETEGYDSFAAAIRGFVSPELVEDGVRITSLDLVDGKVSIKVEAETETAGSAWVKGSKELTVWCQVQWKPSLTGTVWTDLGEPFEITVGTEEAEEIDISDRVPEGDSGYFSVKVYKK